MLILTARNIFELGEEKVEALAINSCSLRTLHLFVKHAAMCAQPHSHFAAVQTEKVEAPQ
jgi:hypothetical protein